MEKMILNLKKQYVEWAKPYGYNPYIIIEFKLEDDSINHELFNSWMNDLEREVNKFYDGFMVDKVMNEEILQFGLLCVIYRYRFLREVGMNHFHIKIFKYVSIIQLFNGRNEI